MGKNLYGARHWKKKFDQVLGTLAHVGVGGVIDPALRAEFLGKKDKLIARQEAVVAAELVRELIMRGAIEFKVEEGDNGELRVSGELVVAIGGMAALEGLVDDGQNEPG